MLSELRAHTTLPTSDVERLRTWYEGVLGFTPFAEPPGAVLYRTAAGSVFAISRAGVLSSGTHTQMAFTVYDIAAERMFEGMVTRAAHSIDGTMYFTLKTAETDVEVQIGPRNFIERNGFKLKVGEMVTVIGVSSILRGREVLLAREIHSSGSVFIIRDRNGEPMWELDRPIQMDHDRAESVLCEMIMS